jgi:chaperonin GroEL (HSP60 family)
VAAGVNVMDLRNGINKAVHAVVSQLKSKASLISTPEEITQVLKLFYFLYMLDFLFEIFAIHQHFCDVSI